MKRFVSQIIGEAHLVDGSRRAAYRALRPLLCSDCAAGMTEGELFTRWPVPGLELDVMPRCLRCAPFRADAAGGGTRSRLLSALLSHDGRDTKTVTSGGAEKVSRPPHDESVERAVEHRLGPALARCRKKRP